MRTITSFRSAALGLIVALSIGLSACTNDNGTEAASSSPTVPSQTDSPTEARPTEAPPAGPSRICKLLKVSEIDTAFGLEAQAPSGTISDCTWPLEDGAVALSLLKFEEHGEAVFGYKNLYGLPGQDPSDPNYGIYASDAVYFKVDGRQGAYVPGSNEGAVLAGSTIVRLVLTSPSAEGSRRVFESLLNTVMARFKS